MHSLKKPLVKSFLLWVQNRSFHTSFHLLGAPTQLSPLLNFCTCRRRAPARRTPHQASETCDRSLETTELYAMNAEAFTELQACKSIFFQEKGAVCLHHTHISILCLIWCLALCKEQTSHSFAGSCHAASKSSCGLVANSTAVTGFLSQFLIVPSTLLCSFRSNPNWLSNVLVRAGFAKSFVSHHVLSTWSTVKGFNWCFQ